MADSIIIDSTFSKSALNKTNKDSRVTTEGIKYSGSKLKLLSHILSIIQALPVQKVLDGFSGTTRVSQALANQGLQVHANDVAIWSKTFGECYLKGRITNELQEKIHYLNSLKGFSGWFTKHYGGRMNGGFSAGLDGKKKIWQIHNTKKLDAIRPEIDKIAEHPYEHAVLLASLILALDRVDNTMGHYVSYLRKWSPRSFKQLELVPPRITASQKKHQITNENIFKILARTEGADLSYFDPPYGSNNEKMPPSRVRYASYYHIWKTVCLNDRPELVGKTNRRKDCGDIEAASVFEEFRRNKEGRFIALEAIEKLIQEANSPYVLLSYSNGGRATKEEISEIIKRQSLSAQLFSINIKRNIMSQMRWTLEWTRKEEPEHTEFLFLIKK